MRRRRCARRRHRMEGVPQSRLRRAAAASEAAGDLRRTQPVRAGRRPRGRLRTPFHRKAMSARFSQWRERVAAATVLIVGDVMLDRYWFGDVERISPEAPVPVVRIARTEERPGGAANVARNVAALGAQATLLSVVGADEPGSALARLLDAEGVRTSFHRDPSVTTT